MISKEDRMYFIDPIQPTMARKTKADGSPLPLQIVALRYRRDNLKQDRVGTIIDVTHQRVEGGELWWVDAEGDYVYGAQLADRQPGRGPRMAIVNDDLFYVGRNGGEHHLGSSAFGSMLTDAHRSDGKRLTGTNTLFTYVAPLTIKAASWASDLMPVAGDTEDIVTAKVARAKQKYIQRHKKGEVYKEGMRRDWLHHLATLRADHDMPIPTFNVGIEGTYLSGQAETVAVDTLTRVQQERLTPLNDRAVIQPNNTSVRDGNVQMFVGRPVTTLTSLTAADLSAMMAINTADIRYAVFDALRVHSGHIMETNRFAILSSF